MRKTKVYFEGSIAGRRLYKENYEKIIEILNKNNCIVTQSVMDAKDSSDPISVEESKKIYSKILKNIMNCDFVVAEMTYGSPGVAMIIQDAIHKYKKPVLVLTHEDKEGRRSVPFTGNPSKLLNVKEYSFKNLENILKDFIIRIQTKIPSNKFTVRFDEELDSYLDYMKLKLKETSKNQTILTILRNQMERDEGYKEFLD